MPKSAYWRVLDPRATTVHGGAISASSPDRNKSYLDMSYRVPYAFSMIACNVDRGEATDGSSLAVESTKWWTHAIISNVQ